MTNPYETNLDRNLANYTQLSPLSFIRRTASVYPDRTAIVHVGHPRVRDLGAGVVVDVRTLFCCANESGARNSLDRRKVRLAATTNRAIRRAVDHLDRAPLQLRLISNGGARSEHSLDRRVGRRCPTRMPVVPHARDMSVLDRRAID